jgi:hypothetical protein
VPKAMARSLVDVGELDALVQDEIAKYGNVKSFHVALWRQAPDETGSNWNARIERINGSALSTFTWWDVVPAMRERFNLR